MILEAEYFIATTFLVLPGISIKLNSLLWRFSQADALFNKTEAVHLA
jgi:hypothetical protein